jgi:hypothetical protein
MAQKTHVSQGSYLGNLSTTQNFVFHFIDYDEASRPSLDMTTRALNLDNDLDISQPWDLTESLSPPYPVPPGNVYLVLDS